MTRQPENSPPTYGSRDVLRRLGQPRVLIMMALGFSSGLPFLLTGNTLGAWLRDGDMELATIGFLSWVGLAYSLKFLWAPLMDHTAVPLLRRFGRRRSWILLAQVVIAIGLIAMVVVGPRGGLALFGALALVVAFASATQDIAVDAWRIESSASGEELGLLSAAYQLGYRVAMLITSALIFNLVARTSWEISYLVMAATMGVGFAAALLATEPTRERSAVARTGEEVDAPAWTLRSISGAILGPFIVFSRAHGTKAVLFLVAVSLYRMPDFVMGPMVNPFYVDLGLSLDLIGGMRASVGLVATVVGVAAGGFSAVRIGLTRTLILGAFLAPISNLGLTLLAFAGPSPEVFGAALSLENFSEGFAGTALIAWMSSLTSFGYAATQYALLSSFYTIPGKLLKGFSGTVVESLQSSFDLTTAYGLFFAGTAAIGLPSIVIVFWAVRTHTQGHRRQ